MDIKLSKEFHDKVAYIKEHLDRPIYFTGLMGAGKSKLGKVLAGLFSVDFVDADQLIVDAAGKTIPDIFEQDGEPHFREIERQVIASKAEEEQLSVVALGGGAFMNDETRATIKAKGLSVFLNATLDTLAERVRNGEGRPLLTQDLNKTTREKLEELIDERYPTYAKADIAVQIQDEPNQTKEQSIQRNVERVIDSLYTHLKP